MRSGTVTGDVLTYAAESSAAEVAAVSVSGGVVSVTALSVGEAEVTVTATDAEGSNRSAAQSFAVTVSHDADGDGLIGVHTPAQLDALRHDLDGDGVAGGGGRGGLRGGVRCDGLGNGHGNGFVPGRGRVPGVRAGLGSGLGHQRQRRCRRGQCVVERRSRLAASGDAGGAVHDDVRGQRASHPGPVRARWGRCGPVRCDGVVERHPGGGGDGGRCDGRHGGGRPCVAQTRGR